MHDLIAENILGALKKIERLFENTEKLLVKTDHILERIERRLEPHHNFTLSIKEINTMAIGALTSPGTASILLALLDNGAPYVLPAGSAYVFTPTLAADDTSVVIAADATTPLQFDVTIPAGDVSTSVTFTASAVDPTGATLTATLTVPFTGVTQQYSISITQTA